MTWDADTPQVGLSTRAMTGLLTDAPFERVSLSDLTYLSPRTAQSCSPVCPRCTMFFSLG